MTVLKYYTFGSDANFVKEKIEKRLQILVGSEVQLQVECEYCFHMAVRKSCRMDDETEKRLMQILKGSPYSGFVTKESQLLPCENDNCFTIEIGPKPNLVTPFSTNAVSVCHSSCIEIAERLERSSRYRIAMKGANVTEEMKRAIVNALHDKMTECPLEAPLDCTIYKRRSPFYDVDLFIHGSEALDSFNEQCGLALDENDVKLILDMFLLDEKRNPTDVELFDLAQSNSEHCRHWFFKGELVVDGIPEAQSLFDLVIETQECSNQNNVIKFCDNSSAINGHEVTAIKPKNPLKPSQFVNYTVLRHPLLTAETHNFPTGICPFPGAATGTGGRIRDVHATGRGAHPIAGVAGYSVGNLNIPGYCLPWELQRHDSGCSFATPLTILIEASNGASDYGNKFGEPVICGFTRTFDCVISELDKRYGYVKPIMFTAGLGAIDDAHVHKLEPENGMLIVKIGGPALPIGIGGGSASSSKVDKDNFEHQKDVEFNAVQRGDPEMEQKLNRVIRASVELGDKNPIASIHDQGAGGNGNVIKELVDPLGAEVYCSSFTLGDATMSVRELWSAEYQESDALLVLPENVHLLQAIAERERCLCDVVGEVNNSATITVHDFDTDREAQYPLRLSLNNAHSSSKRKKTFYLKKEIVHPLELFNSVSLPAVDEVLSLVLNLPSVCCKKFLTNKVDRSVTGLVAQQQCVGPAQLPLADVAVVALSHADHVGAAIAVGEQPIKMLLNPEAGARLTIAESLTNLLFAPITHLKDVKCSANWMWAAQYPEEGYRLLLACKAMSRLMCQIGIAVDGGKDSLRMAARLSDTTTVRAPGTLVVTAYAPCVNINRILTPELRTPFGRGSLIYVKFAAPLSLNRIGGSALAQCLCKFNYETPDVNNSEQFVAAFNVTQRLISSKERIVYAGHDVSDGGLITCLLEMAFAGNCSVTVDINFAEDLYEALFNEESAIIIEVPTLQELSVLEMYNTANVPACKIGNSLRDESSQPTINISVSGDLVVQGSVQEWRKRWEETSYQIERLQCNPQCVYMEYKSLAKRRPPYFWKFNTVSVNCEVVRIAVVREEGTNGDREMAAVLNKVGFEVWDVTMQDLLQSKIDFDSFRGLVFPGGFSYGDVLGAAKGWASSIAFHPELKFKLQRFISRLDTFTLGVCNGCQLMATLGLVGSIKSAAHNLDQHLFLSANQSGRFESRFCTVKVEPNPSIFFKNMHGFVLGVWVAHGEGKFQFETEEYINTVQSHNLIPIYYVDNDGEATECYPENPNGSPKGIAAICSSDGRHLAMMPHPERCFQRWQWPYWPERYETDDIDKNWTPWLTFFENAYAWCLEQLV